MLGKDIVVGHRKGVSSLGYLFDSGGLEVEQWSDNRLSLVPFCIISGDRPVSTTLAFDSRGLC